MAKIQTTPELALAILRVLPERRRAGFICRFGDPRPQLRLINTEES